MSTWHPALKTTHKDCVSPTGAHLSVVAMALLFRVVFYLCPISFSVVLCISSGFLQELSLAVHFTMLTTFDYIRMITASELLALPDAHKINKIHHAFTESYK